MALFWLFFFGTLSVASLTGGTVHGFFPDESAFGYAFLWRTTLIAIGAMALAAWYKTKESALLSGAASIVLTFVGSFVQLTKISLHSQYFTHNALYHAIQFVALCLIFSTARWDITKRRQNGKYIQA